MSAPSKSKTQSTPNLIKKKIREKRLIKSRNSSNQRGIIPPKIKREYYEEIV